MTVQDGQVGSRTVLTVAGTRAKLSIRHISSPPHPGEDVIKETAPWDDGHGYRPRNERVAVRADTAHFSSIIQRVYQALQDHWSQGYPGRGRRGPG